MSCPLFKARWCQIKSPKSAKWPVERGVDFVTSLPPCTQHLSAFVSALPDKSETISPNLLKTASETGIAIFDDWIVRQIGKDYRVKFQVNELFGSFYFVFNTPSKCIQKGVKGWNMVAVHCEGIVRAKLWKKVQWWKKGEIICFVSSVLQKNLPVYFSGDFFRPRKIFEYFPQALDVSQFGVSGVEKFWKINTLPVG